VKYWECFAPTFDNLNGMLKASQWDVKNTITPNDEAHPTGSMGLKNIRDCMAGNKNCKELDSCLAGVIAGGVFPE
jgi:hypothetical protein